MYGIAVQGQWTVLGCHKLIVLLLKKLVGAFFRPISIGYWRVFIWSCTSFRAQKQCKVTDGFSESVISSNYALYWYFYEHKIVKPVKINYNFSYYLWLTFYCTIYIIIILIFSVIFSNITWKVMTPSQIGKLFIPTSLIGYWSPQCRLASYICSWSRPCYGVPGVWRS